MAAPERNDLRGRIDLKQDTTRRTKYKTTTIAVCRSRKAATAATATVDEPTQGWARHDGNECSVALERRGTDRGPRVGHGPVVRGTDGGRQQQSQEARPRAAGRDGGSAEGTADQQKETPEDREITRKIRQALVADKSLSTYAHNVKVVTPGGMVTLKGPVRSEEEKAAVAAKASSIMKRPDHQSADGRTREKVAPRQRG